MTLVACKECRTEISDQAQSCPKCGAPAGSKPPRKWAHHQLVATLLTITGAIMFAGGVYGGSPLILVGIIWFVVARIMR